jgi:hypothetical protein
LPPITATATANATATATALPATATTTNTSIALATTTDKKLEGNVWVTGQRLVAAGEDGWWQQISSSLSEC